MIFLPHRRSRKFLAILLLGATLAFLEHAPVSPVQGQLSYGYPVKLAKVTGTDISGTDISGTNTLTNPNGDDNEPLWITVMAGDTLSTLAHKYFTTVENIVNINKLASPDRIKAGQALIIVPGSGRVSVAGKSIIKEKAPDDEGLLDSPYVTLLEAEQKADKPAMALAGKEADQALPGSSRGGQLLKVSQEELDLLARVIYAEARGEDLQGQIAVAAVVLNRLKDPHFPKTIREVIYQPHAFTAVTDKQIHLDPNDQAYRAAAAALAGTDPTGGALYYYNPRTATDKWIKSRPVVKQIGNHTFSI